MEAAAEDVRPAPGEDHRLRRPGRGLAVVGAVDVGRIVHEQEHAQIAGGVDLTLQPRALARLVGEPGTQQQRVQHDEARGRAHGRDLGEHVTGPGSARWSLTYGEVDVRSPSLTWVSATTTK